MARITPASNVNLEQLRDYEPYPVTLDRIGQEVGSIEYGSEKRLVLDWKLPDETTLRDWISLRLGKQNDGTVAKLRMLLNALAGRHEGEEIAWFDDETLEWSYDGTTPAGVLTPGLMVVARGKQSAKRDGTPRFKIDIYQAAAPATTTQASRPALNLTAHNMQAAPVAASASDPIFRAPRPAPDDDDVPF